MAARRLAVCEPCRVEPLPAVLNHRIGGAVGGRGQRELRRQERRGACRQRLAHPLAVLKHGVGAFGIENRQEGLPR